MTIDFSYYDACYKLCVLNTILNGTENNEVIEMPLSDHLSVITRCFYDFDDGLIGYDYAEFRAAFTRDGKIIDEIVFPNNYKIATKYQRKLWDNDYSMEYRLQAMKALSPSALSKFLQHKPMLTEEERAIVIAKAKELEKQVLEQSEQEKKQM